MVFRNGTIKIITDIIDNLNNASIDSKTGNFFALPTELHSVYAQDVLRCLTCMTLLLDELY